MRLNFGGALAGLGHGLATLGQQGVEEQQRVRADQRLSDRETALATLHHKWEEQATADAPADALALNPALIARAAGIANAEAPARIAVETARGTASAAAQEAHDNREHSFAVAMAALQHTYHMTEEAARLALENSYGDQNVAHVEISRDGQLVQYDRRGRQVAHSQPGTFEPPQPTHGVGGGTDYGGDSTTPNPNLRAPRMIPRDTAASAPVPRSRLTAPTGAAVRVSTPEEAQALPSGSRFITPDGQVRIRQ